MPTAPYKKLMKLLNTQQIFLREGKFQRLSGIARDIEITAKKVHFEDLDEHSFEVLKTLCKRNSELTSAALLGIADAKKLLTLIGERSLKFETYSIP